MLARSGGRRRRPRSCAALGSASRARKGSKPAYSAPLCDANSVRCDLPALTGAPLRSSSGRRPHHAAAAAIGRRPPRSSASAAVFSQKENPARRAAPPRQRIKSTIAPAWNLERAHVRSPSGSPPAGESLKLLRLCRHPTRAGTDGFSPTVGAAALAELRGGRRPMAAAAAW